MGDRAAGKSAHALEHGAAGDAGGGEHDIAVGKVEKPVFAAEIADAAALGALAFVVVAEDEAALHEAADAAKRRGGEHALGRTARAHVNVDAAVGTRGGDDAAHIAVGDEHNARSRLAYPGDELGMARTVQDADDEIGYLGVLRLVEILE